MHLLQHHDVHQRLLRYDPQSGACEELRREDLTSTPTLDFGFYVTHEGAPIGVYRGADGLVIFYGWHGRDRFLLRDPRCQVELSDEDGERHFSLRWEGEERISIRYPAPPDVETHPWDSPEMRDFYLWLANL